MHTVTNDVLSLRSLNRATLQRQMLLERRRLSALEAIEHLVGMQAQAPTPPYVGLWTRLDRFQPSELAELILERKAVRIALMRGTVHLVTADDCLILRPLVQPVFDRTLHTNTTYGPPLRGIDIDALVAAGRALLEDKPRTAKELGTLLEQQWPGRAPSALAYAIRSQAPLVQVPPRGVWGASGQATHTTAESWLGRPLDPQPSLAGMILRYLAAFGPATVRDIQTWSGLNRLGEITERMRPQLRVFRAEDGRELLDVPEAPRPDPGTPAPVRFLPEYDNLVLSHADRSRVVSDEHRKRLMTANGIIPGAILIDGFVQGTWKIVRDRDTAALSVMPFARLSTKDKDGLMREGARLLEFAADTASTHDIRFDAGVQG